MKPVIAALLLLALPACAQNKCVDTAGKVTYQSEPCPRDAKATVLKPPPPGEPVRKGLVTKDELLLSVGRPDSQTSFDTLGGTTELWTYRRKGLVTTFRIRNGEVVGNSETRY